MKKHLIKFRAQIGYVISITLFTVALGMIHHKLKQYHLHDVMREFHQVPLTALLLAGGLTVLNYLMLTLYDTMALRYLYAGAAALVVALWVTARLVPAPSRARAAPVATPTAG